MSAVRCDDGCAAEYVANSDDKVVVLIVESVVRVRCWWDCEEPLRNIDSRFVDKVGIARPECRDKVSRKHSDGIPTFTIKVIVH